MSRQQPQQPPQEQMQPRPSDREAPPEWIDEAARVLSRLESKPTKLDRREVLARALAAVDRAAREECAVLCDEAADEADKYPIAIVRDGARALANAIRETIR